VMQSNRQPAERGAPRQATQNQKVRKISRRQADIGMCIQLQFQSRLVHLSVEKQRCNFLRSAENCSA
ncbi:MAG TPA: hypothetical protein VMD76_07735, partial [Candidatus Sulfotelmatobacter sp.]|nr:hypothetical protein [Candidatus Sulfotelmatobacter sp.]